jgi:hypothetical protein
MGFSLLSGLTQKAENSVTKSSETSAITIFFTFPLYSFFTCILKTGEKKVDFFSPNGFRA